LPKKDPKKEKILGVLRNRSQVGTLKTNNSQTCSDTFGSSFNQASNGALEKVSKTKMPNAMGWGCRDPSPVKMLNSPSIGSIDEHHFASDLRKAKKRTQ